MEQSNAINAASAVAAAIHLQENPPHYLKLNVDCWEHVFEYLALRDIHAMGQTCKRMHQVAGYYFREFCPDLLYVMKEKEIRVLDHANILLTSDFYQFMNDLLIRDQLDGSLDAKTFASLKTLAFNALQMTEPQIELCQNVLRNVENLSLLDCTSDAGDICRHLAIFCAKLKYLDLKNCHEHAVFKKIFSHHYPTLERMKYETFTWNEPQQIDELKVFLEEHTKLKHFECDDRFLWANRNLLNRTDAQLDRLSIYLKTPKIAAEFDQFVDVLRQLYQHGFYRSIHISLDLWYDYDDYEHLITAISTLPTLEFLNIDVLESFNSLSRLTNLTELRIGEPSYVAAEFEMETTIKSLTKLQHLTIDLATIDNILPFMRYSKTLRTIKILDLRNSHALNSFALNTERKKLENANKVVIHVKEHVYLHEKWQTRNLNLSHVKIERLLAFKSFLRS